MHYVKAKGIFTSDYGMNLYRGCPTDASIVTQEVTYISSVMNLKILK